MSEENKFIPAKELEEELEKVNGGTKLSTSLTLCYQCRNCKYAWIEEWANINALTNTCLQCHCSNDPRTGQDCIYAGTIGKEGNILNLPVYRNGKIVEQPK